MKKLALAVIGLALMGGLAVSAPAAFAADATPCSTALLAQTDLAAQVKTADAADKAAADAQKLYDDLAAAQKEEAAAIKADNETVPPLTGDSQRTKDAKAAKLAAQKAVDAFEAKGVTIEKLRKDAAETSAVDLRVKLAAAAVAVESACKGADGAPIVVTPLPQAPQVVVIPRAIDTGEM